MDDAVSEISTPSKVKPKPKFKHMTLEHFTYWIRKRSKTEVPDEEAKRLWNLERKRGEEWQDHRGHIMAKVSFAFQQI